MAKEVEKDSGEEEKAGWEDLTHDPTGSSPKDEPKPEPVVEKESTKEQAQPEPEGEETVELPTPTETGEQATEAQVDDGTPGKLYTLPDGRKLPREEIDDETFEKMVTGWNQQSHFQKRHEEAQQQLQQYQQRMAALEQQTQTMANNWTLLQQQAMVQQAARAQQQAQQPAPTREQLTAGYGPQINELVKGGYVTELEADEHAGLIAGFLWRDAHKNAVIAEQNAALNNVMARLQSLEGAYGSDYQQRQLAEADATVSAVRNELISKAEREKDEFLQPLRDDNNWNNLLKFIGERIAVSNGAYNPTFDAETLESIWYGMPAVRELVRAQRSRIGQIEEGRKKIDQRLSGGEGGRGAVRKGPKPRDPQRPPLPGEEEGWANLDGGRLDLAGNRMEPDANRLARG